MMRIDFRIRMTNGDASCIVANETLERGGLQPFTLGPEQALGKINDTAASAVVGWYR